MADLDTRIAAMKPSNSAKELITGKWFAETEAMWPGQQFCIEVEEVLFNGKSDFQDIIVFKSKSYGIVLVLDGVIQLTERDEFAYQEMITHIPMFAADSAPKRVLIIGGGDGGVLREVAKHESVEVIHMCEIDAGVIDVSKKWLGHCTATSFDDPRLTLMIDDAAKYMDSLAGSGNYDVIICDSSDPVGPASVLFEQSFFRNMHANLSPTGVLCTQGECMWLHLDLIKRVLGETRQVCPSVKYSYTTIPTYPSGQIGFIVGTKSAELDVSEPSRTPSTNMGLRYYSPDIHKTSFILPEFAKKELD